MSVPTCPDTQPCEYFSLPAEAPPAKGTVIIIHGGGWEGPIERINDTAPGAPNNDGPNTVESASQDTYVEFVRDSDINWATLSITYPGIDCDGSPFQLNCTNGQDAFDSLAAIHDWIDWAKAQSSKPIVLAGGSAGANLALIAAAQRDDIPCVISAGGIYNTYSSTGAGGRIVDPNGQAVVPKAVYDLARLAFPGAAPWVSSPRYNIASLAGTDVVIGHSKCDPYAPYQQAYQFRVEMRAQHGTGACSSAIMEPGNFPFVHCNVTQATFAKYRNHVKNFLGRYA